MTRPPPNERPTAAQLAAGNANGWACPRCGCRDLRGEKNSGVESTRVAGDAVRRRRICRHCGQHVIVTKEVPVPEGFKVLVVPDEGEAKACA